MRWAGRNIENVRQMPGPYLYLHVTAKFVVGLGVGVLLSARLPIWSGWLFLVVGLLMTIPGATFILRK